MTVRVRIAPSPTGNLHIGTARTAVFNWLFARHLAGQFILRVEDTDKERSRPEYTQNIQEGLSWLGLTWDEGPFFQSERLELYQKGIKDLLARGLAYRCYTTPEELEEMRAAQKAKGEAPRYDNRHRNLTKKQQAKYEAEGRSAVIRFKIDSDRSVAWQDLVRGTVVWQAKDLGGDMVIARAASAGNIGEPLYNLAVVLDDIDMKITQVIRGEDHIANTAKQILLYEAFEAEIPEFAHTPLILNQSGQKLSKRDGVTSISDFRDMGFVPEALANYMTLLGWSPPDAREVFTLEEAARLFDFERVNKAGAKFDWDKLDWLNSQYLHAMDLSELTNLLIPYWQKAGYEFDATDDRPWLEQITALIAPSLTRLTDAVPMTRVFFAKQIEINEEGAGQLEKEGALKAIEAIREALGSELLTETASAQAIIKQVVKQQKVKKGLVMRSLRAALTGEVHGPDLIQSWLILNQRGLDRTRFEQILKTDVEEAPILVENTSTTSTPEPLAEKEVVSPTQVVEPSTPEVVAETPASGEEPLPESVAETPESVAETPTPEPSVAETPTPEEEAQPETVAETPSTEEEAQPETVEPIASQESAETPTPEEEPQPETVAETPSTEEEAQPETVEPIASQESAETPTPEEEPQPETVAETPSTEEEAQPETVEPIASQEPAETPTPEEEAQPETVAETPSTEEEAQPETVEPIASQEPAETPSTPSVPETAEETISPIRQLQAIGQKVLLVLSDLPEYVIGFFGEYQKLLAAIALIIGALLSIKILVAVVDTFNSLPLFTVFFEVIGIGYSGWFICRYLLAAKSRQELLEIIQDFKKQIAGDKESQ
ncbi:MAG: glutamate--tRNA ligase [Oscillatoria sp. SIO1A7]|nr:glutamate--tRNA ligase [Oscillatoria sp. SIO1A7]